MPRRATHKGHCQICGACQKLPAGLLSKHGYTTRWGFFEGVCPGSGHPPFEEDISLIEGAIARATEEAARVEERAAATRMEADPDACWFHAYFNWGYTKGRRSGYEWIKTRLADKEAAGQAWGLWAWHPGDAEAARWVQSAYYGGGGIVEAARQFNNDYADRYLGARIKNLRDYVEWQRGRIKGWTPQPLIPLADCERTKGASR